MMRTVEEWGRVQARWLYLLAVFSSKDIINQMPEEGKLFEVNYHLCFSIVQGDKKVSVRLMVTIQKVTRNVQSVPHQSPDIQKTLDSHQRHLFSLILTMLLW
jgi:hypothetical protein